MRPQRGDIAYCGMNALGLITSEKPVLVRDARGEYEIWEGVHLTDKYGKMGMRWLAKNPRIVGKITDLIKDIK